MIPYGRQDITQDDIDSVLQVLESDFITQGPAVPRFEKEVSDYCGAAHAVAVNSATSALHIACLALKLGRGDWLWTTPISFVASANCGLYCGAKIDFVDIDPLTFNLCPGRLEEKLKHSKSNGTLPKVVVVVHFAGQSADMVRIDALSKQYDFRIIEDAAHAIGGRYRGEPIGSCRYSDVTVFSFHPVKIITTAEGGVATTNSLELQQEMRLLRSHGITRDPSCMRSIPEGDWYYEQLTLGFNYRLTDLQAALGISQMQRLDDYVLRRHEIADRYDSVLADLPIVLHHQVSDSYSSRHLYPILIDPAKTSVIRESLFASLRESGIGVNVHYIPIYRHPVYKSMSVEAEKFPVAEDFYSRTLTLPLYPTMTTQDQSFIEEQLFRILGRVACATFDIRGSGFE